jgi:hypothetical protein
MGSTASPIDFFLTLWYLGSSLLLSVGFAVWLGSILFAFKARSHGSDDLYYDPEV